MPDHLSDESSKVADLLKHTATDHPDRFNLQVALTELDNLAHKLNDRKRLSTQILEASQLFKNMDIRHVRQRSEDAMRLIRQDDITESHCTGQNQTPRWKPLRLSLLNDALLCTHPLIKSGKTGKEEKHRLKWSVPLSAVTIKDSVITPDTNVALKSQPGHVVITSTRPPRGMESALYSELDGLIHDFTVITQITSLVSSLKRSYQELSEDSLQSLTRSIQIRIQTLDEHLRTMDSSSLQLLIRSKQGKRHVIVDFRSAEVKRKWLQELRMQEIASLPSNNPSWLDSHATCKLYPLYITQLNLNITNEMNQIICGAPFNLSTNWGASTTRKFLWLCGCNEVSPGESRGKRSSSSISESLYETSVVIVAVDAQNLPHVVESFKLCGERVTSCLIVKGVTGMFKMQKSRRKNIDTVWMATDNKTIRIHNLAESSRQKPLCVIEIPESVTQLVSVGHWIFAATDSGIIRFFDASRSDSWHIMCTERSLHVSERSVDVLCWDGEKLWVGSGRVIMTVDTASLTVLRSFEVNQTEDVCYLARSGVGLFVGFRHRAQIQLYHTETFTHLQDINLASSLRGNAEPAGGSTSGDLSYITCLSVIEHWLWIGTSIGCVLLVPLPRLEGVPLISSRALVARHSHKGPVRFLLSTEKHLEVDKETNESDGNNSFNTPDANDSLRTAQKWRSMNDLDSIDQTDDHDRIKSLYSNLLGLKSEDLDQVLENQFSASDSLTHAKGSLTLPASSKRSIFAREGLGSEEAKVKECDDYRLVLAGGEGYIDRKDHQGSDCGPNVQVWCSPW